MKTGIFNVETRVATDGNPYIMEFTPRGGGNRLAEMLQYATGAPLISNSVRACVGLPLLPMNPCEYKGNWMEIILHAEKDGSFDKLHIDAEFGKYVVDLDLWVETGDEVHAFRGANEAIGTVFLRCPSEAQIEHVIEHSSEVFRVVLK